MFNSFSFNVSLYFLVLRFEEHCIHLKLYIETNEMRRCKDRSSCIQYLLGDK